jgi:hypothetical protein
MGYGEQFTPAGAPGAVKVRGPVWVGVCTFITFGLVVFPIFLAYEQSELNKAWAAEGAPVPNALPEPPVLAQAQADAPDVPQAPERPQP